MAVVQSRAPPAHVECRTPHLLESITDSGPFNKEFDEVKHLQRAEDIEASPSIEERTLERTHLISSPYRDLRNQLDLRYLDDSSRLFALALSNLTPVRDDYATALYMDAFNWSEVFAVLRSACLSSDMEWREQQFHVVIFRSRLREGVDRVRLGELDQRSHEEACASGGLLKYWFGTTDRELRNLASCIWRNQEDAAAGGRGPWHRQARAAAPAMYAEITFHTHKLLIEENVRGWRLLEGSK